MENTSYNNERRFSSFSISCISHYVVQRIFFMLITTFLHFPLISFFLEHCCNELIQKAQTLYIIKVLRNQAMSRN